jgi:hypothetical protein
VKVRGALSVRVATGALLVAIGSSARAQQLGSGGSLTPTAVSIPPSVVNASAYGVFNDPTCSTDQTSAIRSAIAVAYNAKLVLPSGANICLKTAGWTLQVTSQIEIDGQGAFLSWDAPSGTAIAPIIDFQSGATHSRMYRINFNANFADVTYTDSTYFGTNPWGDIAVSIQADYFSMHDVFVENGFDDCIGIEQLASNVAVAGKPQWFTLNDIVTKSCGSGVHSSSQGGPGHIGAGIDNGAGSAGTISNAVDYFSYESFLADVGAGSYAAWTNIVSFYAQADPTFLAAHTSTDISYGAEPAVYVGGANNSFTNLQIIAPANIRLWHDHAASGTTYSGLDIKGPVAGDCLFVKGPIVAEGVICSDANAPYVGMRLTSSAGSYTDVNIHDFTISNAVHTPSYSVYFQGSNSITGKIATGPLVGTNAAIGGTQPAGVTVMTFNGSGVGINNPSASYTFDVTGAMRAQASVPLYLTNPTSGNFLVGKTDQPSTGQFQFCYWTGSLCSNIEFPGTLSTQGYPILSLPACNSALQGARAHVTNGQSSPSFLGAVSTTGSVVAPVFCNGSGWVYGG